MFTVYVIRCDQVKYYIGYTGNLAKRLDQHNKGESSWTSRFTNWKVVHKEEFTNKSEAIKREKFLKRMKSGDVFKKIINNYDAG